MLHLCWPPKRCTVEFELDINDAFYVGSRCWVHSCLKLKSRKGLLDPIVVCEQRCL